MSDTPIIETREGGIVRLHFNRPKVLNAINTVTAEALLAAARRLPPGPECWRSPGHAGRRRSSWPR